MVKNNGLFKNKFSLRRNTVPLSVLHSCCKWGEGQLRGQSENKPNYWPFVRGILPLPLAYTHKRAVMQKPLPCHDATKDVRVILSTKRLCHPENRSDSPLNWSSVQKKKPRQGWVYVVGYHMPVLRVSMRNTQGRIQDLKLGVAQMDWKIWKPGGVLHKYINISKYDYYRRYIYYIFQIKFLIYCSISLAPLLIRYCNKKSYLEKF